MTEKMSKKMLDGVQFATGSVMVPVLKSQAGKSFLAMAPGEVLLASLDAISEYLIENQYDASELVYNIRFDNFLRNTIWTHKKKIVLRDNDNIVQTQ